MKTLITAGTVVFTIYIYVIVPKGFFPVEDTGVIQGISEAPETILKVFSEFTLWSGFCDPAIANYVTSITYP